MTQPHESRLARVPLPVVCLAALSYVAFSIIVGEVIEPFGVIFLVPALVGAAYVLHRERSTAGRETNVTQGTED